MEVNVLFLGPAKDVAGVERVSLDFSDRATVGDLRLRLAQRFEGLTSGLHAIRFAVNETFAGDETLLCDGDEVALIPPVSGGSPDQEILIDLVTDPIVTQRVRSFAADDSTLGAIVTFEGATRRDSDATHGTIVRLEYEAYESMARRQLERLAVEAKRRWSAGRIAIVHRIGPVPPGDVSVVIVVACGHRAEAFEACRWLIDMLKQDVPIWKKDVYEDGHVRWVQPATKEVP